MWDLALDGNTSGSGSLGKWPSKLQTSWASLVTQTVKNLPTMQKTRVRSLVGKIPWRRAWHPTPIFLPGESHGQEEELGGL